MPSESDHISLNWWPFLQLQVQWLWVQWDTVRHSIIDGCCCAIMDLNSFAWANHSTQMHTHTHTTHTHTHTHTHCSQALQMMSLPPVDYVRSGIGILGNVCVCVYECVLGSALHAWHSKQNRSQALTCINNRHSHVTASTFHISCGIVHWDASPVSAFSATVQHHYYWSLETRWGTFKADV